MTRRTTLLILVLLSLFVGIARSQQLGVPELVRYTVAVPADLREAAPRQFSVTARIYAGDLGGSPLWSERLEATPDANWRISLLLGSTNPIPPSVFAFNSARGIRLPFDDGAETARAALISVPYALKARDADTLGGLPSSAFLTSSFPLSSATVSDNNGRITTSGTTTYTSIQPGAFNMVPKFVSAVELGGSQITDTGLGVGIGNSTPQEMLDIQGRAILRNTARGPAGLWFGSNEPNSLFFGLRTSDPQSPFGFYYGDAWRINFTRDGRVGLGVDSPAAALDVNGGIKLTSGALLFPDGTSLTSASTASLSIVPADASISIGSSGSSTTIAVADKGISTAKLADSAVSTAKIADASITAAKFAPGALGGAGTVTLGSNAFTAEQIVQVNTAFLPAISAVNSSPTDLGNAIYAETDSPDGVAIKAYAASSTGAATAVSAITNAQLGRGSYSQAIATTGANIGAYGVSRSSAGTGVKGETTATAGTTYGVYGQTAGGNHSTGVYGVAANSTANTLEYGVYGLAQGIYGIGVLGFADNAAIGGGSPIGVVGWVDSTYGVAGQFVNTAATGNILLAQNSGGNVWRVDVAGNQYMSGTVHTGGADFAELIESLDAARPYGPGDVLVIATTGDRRVELASEPYSTRVLGIFATKPGILASRDAVDSGGNRIPVAMLGIVPAKASAENGAIQRGDLLVTAATPGHVMKATDRPRFIGAIVGKAMQPLDSGTGVIEIAVTLQ